MNYKAGKDYDMHHTWIHILMASHSYRPACGFDGLGCRGNYCVEKKQEEQIVVYFLPLQRPDIPWWQSAKSYFRGSRGSIFLRAPVISSAAFQSDDTLVVNPRQRAIRAMWVSRGIINFEGAILSQMPISTSFFLTIHLRKRFIRLHALPFRGEGNSCTSP